MMDLAADIDLAAALAERAGALLLALRREVGLAGRALGDAGDARANALLMAALAEARPDDALLSEESADDRARLAARRVWIVDPLDGTREYSEGRDDWAVHVALSIDGHAAAGAVAIPARGEVWRSDMARPAPAAPPRLVVSRSRAPEVAGRVAATLGAELLPMGSAGAKAMAVLRGEAAAYLHAGGQHEWDSCAPAAVALGAGLDATRLDGSPLRYNQADTYIPDLLISRPEWTARLRAALEEGAGL